MQLDMYQLIGTHWRELVADLREGRVAHCPYLQDMTPADRDIVAKLTFKPNPKRAAELEVGHFLDAMPLCGTSFTWNSTSSRRRQGTGPTKFGLAVTL